MLEKQLLSTFVIVCFLCGRSLRCLLLGIIFGYIISVLFECLKYSFKQQLGVVKGDTLDFGGSTSKACGSRADLVSRERIDLQLKGGSGEHLAARGSRLCQVRPGALHVQGPGSVV